MKLLMIADDFTGALDTGVQFAKVGVSTSVRAARELKDADISTSADVLVLDTETRHLPADEAYRIVYDIVCGALRRQGLYLYKKTDSILRGNIGAELTAMLDASGSDKLAFVPALPQQNRVTLHAMQMVDGRPISEGALCNDLFEPVTCSYIPDIVAKQSTVQTVAIARDGYGSVDWRVGGKEIWLFDAVTQADIETVAEELCRHDRLRVMAGCAGFASTLPRLLGLSGAPRELPMHGRRLVVICGSVNPITREQIVCAQANGFARLNLSADDVLGGSFSAEALAELALACCKNGAPLIIDANDLSEDSEKAEYAKRKGILRDEMRLLIANRLGAIAKEITVRLPDVLPAFIGGDTLFGFLSQMKISELYPVSEPITGCVLSLYDANGATHPVVSKSGGFGNSDLLIMLNGMTKERTAC